jgi:alkylated DNA repair dioxygenase AlkB
MTVQPTLFALGAPSLSTGFPCLRHLDLGEGAWVDHHPSWLAGADAVFAAVRDGTEWHTHRRPMYDKIVDVPRMMAQLDVDAAHPIVGEARAVLSAHYRLDLLRVTAARYRDGNDSVAWHGDKMGELVTDTVVAILSLGGPRRFLLRQGVRGKSMAFTLGSGDLLVMGGTCQHTCQHAIPKVAHAEPRIALMFRPVWKE